MVELLWIQLAVTWTLVGLIWVIQVVHYPLLAAVGTDAYPHYQREHMRRITWLVGPLMATEVILAIVLAIDPPANAASWMAPAALALVGLIWLSTMAFQVPLHTTLERGFDARAHRRLVDTNWLRTTAWSLRGILAIAMLT